MAVALWLRSIIFLVSIDWLRDSRSRHSGWFCHIGSRNWIGMPLVLGCGEDNAIYGSREETRLLGGRIFRPAGSIFDTRLCSW
jgi:hypothetical protein